MKKNTAFITGATSGIGLAFAEHFASKNYNLVLTGRREPILQENAKRLEQEFKIKVKIIVCDFAQNYESVLKEIRISKPQVLINNAGFGISGPFHESDIKVQKSLIDVHVKAPVDFCKIALKNMIKERKGIIINVSSVAAFTPFPGSSIYVSSKAFLKSFSESLAMEVKQYNIKVQALCPGLTITDFFREKKRKAVLKNRFLWLTPERVVKSSIRCLKKNHVVCIPGLFNRLLAGMVHVSSRRMYYNVIRQDYKNKNKSL